MPEPTRRHNALIPLTHDHHHALHNLRLLRLAAEGDDEQRTTAARAFADFFAAHSVEHFREEEEELFPAVQRVAAAQLAGLTLAERRSG